VILDTLARDQARWHALGLAGEYSMRIAFLPFLAVLVLAPSTVLADERIEASTLDAITALATRGYANPAIAELRAVRKSKAMNGLGYCGEVSLAEGGGFTVFHVILGENGAAGTVIRLAEFPENDQSPHSVVVREMLKNFGCLE
jgi:hypothetical protein